MEKSWIFDSIFGGDDPTPARDVPGIAIIDNPKPITAPPRSESLTRLLEIAERDAAIEKIYGAEMLAMLKNPGSPEEPSTNTLPPSLVPVPAHVANPRKIQCSYPCAMGQSQSRCFNCLGDEDGQRCEFSTLTILDDLIPVDAEQQHAEMVQAAKRQRQRIASNRIAKHRCNLAPMVADFRDRIGKRINPVLFTRLLDAMASNIAKGLASY